MAIGLRAAGAWSFGINSFAPAIPAAQVTGDMMILVGTGKPYDSGMSVSTTGWTSLGSGASGTTAAGVDTGSMKLQVWYKEATSDTETNPTITEGTPTWNVMGGVVYVMSKGASEVWSTPAVVFGADETTGTAVSVTFGSDPGGAGGDYVILATGINTDAMGPLTTDLTPSWTGITFGTADTGIEGETTSGGDMAGHIMSRPVSSGTSSAAPTATGTGTATGGADRLEAAFIRLRVVTNYTIATQDIQLGITEDNDTITQNHIVATQDVQLGLTEDNDTITQNHTLSTQDLQLGITTDNTTVEPIAIIAPNDISIGLTIDNATIAQNHIVSVDDISLGSTLDNTTINQNHVISTNDISLTLNTDNTSIIENYTVVTNDLSLGLTTDNTTITQNHVISVNDVELGLTTDNTTITQNHVIAVNDVSLGLTTDNTTLTANHILVVQDVELKIMPELDQYHLGTGNNYNFGDTGIKQLAQEFVPKATDNLRKIKVRIRNQFESTDEVELKIYSNIASNPDTLIATSNNSFSGATHSWLDGYFYFEFTFDRGVALTADTHYWWVAQRTGALDSDNTYALEFALSGTYTAGQIRYLNYFDIWEEAGEGSDFYFAQYYYDEPTITQNHVLAVNDTELGLTTDNTTVVETNYVLSVQDISLGLTTDNTSITENYTLVVNDTTLGLTTDNTTITQNHIFTLNDISLGLTLDNTTVSGESDTYTLIVADLELGLTEDNASLNILYQLATNDIELGIMLDNITIALFEIVERNVIELIGIKRVTYSSGLGNTPSTITGIKPSNINIEGEK